MQTYIHGGDLPSYIDTCSDANFHLLFAFDLNVTLKNLNRSFSKG